MSGMPAPSLGGRIARAVPMGPGASIQRTSTGTAPAASRDSAACGSRARNAMTTRAQWAAAATRGCWMSGRGAGRSRARRPRHTAGVARMERLVALPLATVSSRRAASRASSMASHAAVRKLGRRRSHRRRASSAAALHAASDSARAAAACLAQGLVCPSTARASLRRASPSGEETRAAPADPAGAAASCEALLPEVMTRRRAAGEAPSLAPGGPPPDAPEAVRGLAPAGAPLARPATCA
mmetsp:Transcript_26754/g.100607  ORF Transcript_26754/g.100607 Transcript_26754/m.100607 type:complete len:240 (+) Transcript_26754:2818-3537(+)